MLERSQPELYLACPVCEAFNPADDPLCLHCGCTLYAVPAAAQSSRLVLLRKYSPHSLLFIALLLAAVQGGIVTYLWEQRHTVPSSQSGPALLAHPESEAQVPPESREADPSLAPPLAGSGTAATSSAPPAQSREPSPQTAHQTGRRPVKLILYDREGDILRQVTAAVAEDGRSILTSFESIRGAYRAAVRMPDRRVLAIDAAELADPEGDRAVLSLAASMPGANPTAVPLGALAEAAYEETALEQRYLAEKRGKAERWEEAITHWKRALEMDPSLRPAVEAALEEAYLKAHAAALAEGREQDAQLRLQEAIEWLPDRGPLRLRFAESYAAREEYREAIEQYLLASELLSSQEEDTTPAIVRTYRQWGQALLRQGQFTAAANMFREALQWDGANGELYFAWGKAEFHQRALHAAIQAFEAAQIYDPSLRSEVEPYLLKAQALLEGPRAAVIDFPPGATRIEVPVVLNGRLEVPFILDTGASVTLVPGWAADMLGYGAQGTSRWVEIQTAGGPRRLLYAVVSRLEIQGLSVSNLSVVFGDLPGDHRLKGLLGMDVLRQFSIAVDHEIGRMTLRLK